MAQKATTRETYIALLRGINVGGHTVKMERMRELFEELGVKKVRSYIQTGNLFFEAAKQDEKKLAAKIEKHLHGALGYEVPVFLETVEEFEKVLTTHPFKKIKVTDDLRLCVVWFRTAAEDLTTPYWSPKRDMQIVSRTPRVAYVIWHILNGRPPAANVLDKSLGKITTTRFFHTAQKILDAAKASES